MDSRHVLEFPLFILPRILTGIPDITGPETATTGVVLIYDVFGFGPQILQVYMLFRTKGWRILCFFFLRLRSDGLSLNGIEILGS